MAFLLYYYYSNYLPWFYQAHFALSNDAALQRQGSAIKIDYEADYYLYLKYLVKGHWENKSSVKLLFRTWNEYFFPFKLGPGVAPRTVAPRMIDEAFAALEDDNSDDNEDANPQPSHSVPTNPTLQLSINEVPQLPAKGVRKGRGKPRRKGNVAI